MTANDSSMADPFGAIADEFVQAFREGKHPLVEEFARRYPQHADEIREILPALVLMEKAKAPNGPTGQRDSAAELPLQQLGDYQILRQVGRGGMGVVYEAQQLSLGRHVAIKVLPAHALLDARHLGRFQREARSAAKLHHTNIVPVFGVGEQDGLHYFVMQFIHGLGLDVVLTELRRLRVPRTSPTGNATPGDPTSAAVSVARGLLTGDYSASGEASAPRSDTLTGGLTPPRSPDSSAIVRWPGQKETSTPSDSGQQYWQSVARIGMQVADALAHAASQGVLHRDIKPSNLLLDDTGNVWVTDFGLAKADSDGDNLTHTGDIVGTLRYMAPERFNGQGDLRSDIYSLGLTLYELLALRPAFDEADRSKLIKQVMHDEPVRPRKINPKLPRDLETVVLKAIARDPAHRYQTPAEMAEDLKRFVEDRPVLARRISNAEKLWRWCRRNPGIAVLGGALAVVLLVATVASLLAANYFNRLRLNERDAREEAEQSGDEARRRGDAERWGRYRSNIAAAAAALQVQNSGVARSALDEAPKEHRNWEWRYFHSQLDGPSLVVAVPGGKIKSLVVAPSGRQFAVCCRDQNEAYLYDVATGRLDSVLRGHSAPVTSVAYRPDGKQLATIGNDQTLRLWDPATGRELTRIDAEVAPPRPNINPEVVYSPDGSRIAAGGGWDAKARVWLADAGGTSRLWDAQTGQELAVLTKWQEGARPVAFRPDGKRLAVAVGGFIHLCDAAIGRTIADLGPHARSVRCLSYSPDGKRIVSGDVTDVLYLWDGESGDKVAELRVPKDELSCVRFSPDGSRLATGSIYPDNSARLWDAATGERLHVLTGHKNEITDVVFSPDGKSVATASSDQTARLWNANTGQLLAVLSGHTDRVRNLLFSPDGTRVVTASDDATLRVWDARTGELISVLRGHSDVFVVAPVFTPDGSRLVSASADGTMRVWDMTLVERNGILRGHRSYVYDVAFSPDGEQVASAAWDGTVRLWDATTGRQTGDPLKHETLIVNSVAYSRDGRLLAAGEREKGITLWDVASRKPARDSRLLAPVLWDNGIGFNPEGTLLASGSFDGPVRLWDVAAGRVVAQLDGHDRESKTVAFHPDGRLLASGGQDGTIRLWDVATRESVTVLRGHTDMVWRVAFSADGKLLASGAGDKTIRLWDVETRKPLARIQQGSIVYAVAFSPDGSRLAAGCRDNTVRLFDVASRDEVAELRGHTDYVHAVAWSPDGTRLVSGSGDFTVRVWDSLSALERMTRTNANAPK